MKHWRRGIQDVDYLTLAAEINPVRTAQIVEEMIPVILWEVGCEIYQGECDGWIQTDTSGSNDPDVWEKARAELADIIEGKSTVTEQEIEPEPEPEPGPKPEPEQENNNILVYMSALFLLVIVTFFTLRIRK